MGCFERQSRRGPRINVSVQRERKLNAAPLPVWELDWQDCPAAFRLRGLARHVISVKIPLVSDERHAHIHTIRTALVHRAP